LPISAARTGGSGNRETEYESKPASSRSAAPGTWNARRGRLACGWRLFLGARFLASRPGLSALDLLEHLENGAGRALEHALQGLRQATTFDGVAAIAVDIGHQWLRWVKQRPVVYRTHLLQSRPGSP